MFNKLKNLLFNNREIYIWPLFYLALFFVVVILIWKVTGRAPQADVSDLLGYIINIVPVWLAILIATQADGHLTYSLDREEWLRASLWERILDAACPVIIFIATLVFEYFFLRH